MALVIKIYHCVVLLSVDQEMLQAACRFLVKIEQITSLSISSER